MTFRGSIPHPVQSLCTLRNRCRQRPRNTRYQADATPYLGRTCTGWIAPACGWRTYSITSSTTASSDGGTSCPIRALGFQVFRPVFGPELSSLPPSLLPLLLGEVGWRRGASITRITNSHEEFFLSRRRAHAKHSRRAIGDILEEVRRICRDVNCRASVYNRLLAAESEFY